MAILFAPAIIRTSCCHNKNVANHWVDYDTYTGYPSGACKPD
jgi:hypothetical protein